MTLSGQSELRNSSSPQGDQGQSQWIQGSVHLLTLQLCVVLVSHLYMNVSGEEQRADNDQQRPDQEEERRQGNGFVGNFRWTSLKLSGNTHE